MKWLLFIPIVSASLFVQIADPNELVSLFGFGEKKEFQVEKNYALLSWNVYKAQREGYFEDFANFLDNHDILSIQEFYLNDAQREQIENYTHLNWVFAKSFRYSRTWNGVVNIASVEPIEVIPQKSEGREPILRSPKMALITKYPISDGRELWLLNIHSLNFNPTHRPWRRQLDRLLDELEGFDGPVLFAGDLNTWASHRRNYLMERTAELGLSWAQMESPMGPLNRTLDYIFYRGVEVIDHEVLEDINTSDHKPLRMEFRIPSYVGS